MMTSNFNAKSAKAVWRNIAVAVFAVCFALLGLGVTVLPTRATDEDELKPLLVTDSVVKIGTAELGEYPQTYAGDLNTELLAALKELEDGLESTLVPTEKTYATSAAGKEILSNEYIYGDDKYVAFNALNSYSLFDGTKITKGETYFFKVEPIKWDIFYQAEDNKLFAVSTQLLGAVSFNALGKSGSSWQDSYLRYHLNSNLLNEAELENYAAPRKYYADGSADNNGVQLVDKLWSPSYWELPRFYKTPASSRVKTITDYGSLNERNDNERYYFLRSTTAGTDRQSKVSSGIGDRSTGDVYYGMKSIIEAYCTAFVLSEAAISEIYGEPTAMTVTYDNTDQQVKNWSNQPDWYVENATICSYTKDGEPVEEVKDVGVYDITITLGEYVRTTTLTVSPRPVVVTDTFAAVERVYDQKREVNLDISQVTFTGLLTDLDGVDITFRGFMNDKNAGTDKDVTVTATLTGDADAVKNYVLMENQFTTKVTITPRPVTIANVEVIDKEYDGTTRAFLDTKKIMFTGIVEGDGLTVAIDANYLQETMGDEIVVTLKYLSLLGNDAANYDLVIEESQKETKGSIKKRAITIAVDDQVVKVDTTHKTLTAHTTSGSLVNGHTIEDVCTLTLDLSSLINPEDPEAEIDLDHLPAGKYIIWAEKAKTEIADNYEVRFDGDGFGTYRVLSAEEWDALQPKEEPKDNNMWLIIIIVMAIAAFIGALVGIGLVIRSHDKNRDPKPKKEKQDKKQATDQTTAADGNARVKK